MKSLATILLLMAAAEVQAADGCFVTNMGCNSRIAGTLGGSDLPR